MRNFTNDQVFDDTIPARDGEMEIGARVPLERLRTAMEDWFRRKSYLPKDAILAGDRGVNQFHVSSFKCEGSLQNGLVLFRLCRWLKADV